MADTSKIEWTDATWNVITGCTLVSDGCNNCYAAQLAATRLKHHPSRKGLARRNAAGVAKFTGEVRFNEQWLTQPLHWRKPRHIFVCAHGDLFHENVPDEWIDKVFAVMALCPQHTFQVLTKRADRMRWHLTKLTDDGAADRLADIAGQLFDDQADVFVANFINGWSSPRRTPFAGDPADGTVRRWPLPNVWLGVSAEDQTRADERIPALLATPAAIRFVSAEPLLGPVDLKWYPHEVGIGVDRSKEAGGGSMNWKTPPLDWVIVGGESGRNARPMHPNWARGLRDQCQAAEVPFFFKQWGVYLHESQDPNGLWDWSDADERNILHHWPDGTASIPLHKGAAGSLLDGREWKEMP